MLCGPLTWTYTINVVSAANYVYSTISTIFALTFTTTQATMTVTPTLAAEEGTYSLAISACLTNYAGVCGTKNMEVTINPACVTGLTLSLAA